MNSGTTMASATVPSRRGWLLLVGALSFLVVSALVIVARRPRLDIVSSAQLDMARARWRAAKIESYEVEVEVQGRQAAVYRVEVRGGEVRAATRNGQPLKGFRTLGTWSVPGMFSTMELDLEHQERVAVDRAANLPQVEVRAEFDTRFGYPVRCHRIQWGGAGANPDVVWEIKVFRELEPE